MSFILWLGGKKRILPHIDDIICDYMLNNDDDITYVEPFIGSGIVLIHLLEVGYRKFKRYICSDINPSLINAFNQIKSNHWNLIRSLEHVQEYYLSLTPDSRKQLFYRARELFNDIRFGRFIDIRKFDNLVSSNDMDLLHACLFIFLNKT